jgi:hypothetical protein
MIRKGRFVSKINWLYTIWLFIVCSIISALFWLFYHPPVTLGHYFVQVQSWLAHRQHVLQKSLTKIKNHVIETKYESIEPAVHFEFYTSLPNMQNMQNLQPLTLTEEQNSAEINKTVTSSRIVNAEELEREFAHHLASIRGEKK